MLIRILNDEMHSNTYDINMQHNVLNTLNREILEWVRRYNRQIIKVRLKTISIIWYLWKFVVFFEIKCSKTDHRIQITHQNINSWYKRIEQTCLTLKLCQKMKKRFATAKKIWDNIQNSSKSDKCCHHF